MTPAEVDAHQRKIYRAQARQVLGSMISAVSGWEALTHSLEELGFGEQGQRLRGHLHNVYSDAGSLLSALAPWREESAPTQPPQLVIPDDDEDEDPAEEAKSA